MEMFGITCIIQPRASSTAWHERLCANSSMGGWRTTARSHRRTRGVKRLALLSQSRSGQTPPVARSQIPPAPFRARAPPIPATLESLKLIADHRPPPIQRRGDHLRDQLDPRCAEEKQLRNRVELEHRILEELCGFARRSRRSWLSHQHDVLAERPGEQPGLRLLP